MDNRLEQPPVLQRKSYWSPLTVLVLAVFLFTLIVSGVRVQDTVAAREPSSLWGKVVAGAAALCIEGTTALISYRIFDLRRRGRPVPRLLVGGLLFFVTTSVAANVDHSFRYAQTILAGRSGETLAWEILLSVSLSIAAPSGLLLFAEMLSEYVQSVDAENAVLLEKHRAELRKIAERERRRAERTARKSAENRQAAVPNLPAERRRTPEEGPHYPAEHARKEVDLDGWQPVFRQAGAGSFDVSLVQQALGLEKSAAYERLKEAVAAGLIRRDGRGRYLFSVPGTRRMEDTVRRLAEDELVPQAAFAEEGKENP